MTPWFLTRNVEQTSRVAPNLNKSLLFYGFGISGFSGLAGSPAASCIWRPHQTRQNGTTQHIHIHVFTTSVKRQKRHVVAGSGDHSRPQRQIQRLKHIICLITFAQDLQTHSVICDLYGLWFSGLVDASVASWIWRPLQNRNTQETKTNYVFNYFCQTPTTTICEHCFVVVFSGLADSPDPYQFAWFTPPKPDLLDLSSKWIRRQSVSVLTVPKPELLDSYSSFNRTPSIVVQMPPKPDLLDLSSKWIRRQSVSVLTVPKPDLLDLYSSFNRTPSIVVQMPSPASVQEVKPDVFDLHSNLARNQSLSVQPPSKPS